MTHPRTGIEARWAEYLANENAQSLTLVGERSSGLSSLGDEILREVAVRLGPQAPVVISLDAQGLPAPQDDSPAARHASGRRCLTVLADLAAGQLTSSATPTDTAVDPAEDVAALLGRRLAALCRGGRPPLIYIDHFEYLASRLDKAAWEDVRGLVDRRSVQLLLLSRFQLSELDPLTGSRLFGVMPNSVQVSPLGSSERRQLARTALLQSGVSASADVVDYVAVLGGGWRWLTADLGRLIAHHSSRLPTITRDTVDLALAEGRDRVRSHLVRIAPWMEPDQEPDGILARELEREAAAVFELLYAPAGLVTPLDHLLQRLKRLGHIESRDAAEFRFSTPLMRSLAKVRWRELRQTGSPVDPKYAIWWELDEALRRRIRADRSFAQITELASETGLADAVAAHHAARIWWGETAGIDPLDELTTDGLLAVLRIAGIAGDWLGRWREQLDAIARVRPTLLQSQPIAPWGVVRRQQEEARARTVLADMPGPEAPTIAVPPMARRVVSWLHISDVHLGREQKAGEDFVLRSFLEELRKDTQRSPEARLGPPPDLVFFTGDLANQGRPEEYTRAATLLDELLQILRLERRHLFLVPGNHDVYRPHTQYLTREYQNDEEIHQVIQDKRWQRLYRERLGAFDEFMQSYFAQVPERLRRTPLGFPEQQHVEKSGIKMLIHMLDPLLCSADDKDKGKLLLGLIARRAEFAECQSADLRLALMHHPPDWLCAPDMEHFGKRVGENIDLLLGGHVHKGEFKRTISTFGSMCELRAGALFQGDNYENTAQFATFDLDSRELLVFPIAYMKDRDRWVRDPRFGEYPTYTHREVLSQRSHQGK